MKRVTLETISSIQVGYSFRSSINKVESGLLVLQLKDVADTGEVVIDGVSRVEDCGFKDTHYIVPGDVVFRSRGQLFKAAVVPSTDEQVVFAAPLMRLRVDSTVINPMYLAWYINQPKAQQFFNGNAAGSALQMISKTILAAMPIELPEVAEQKIIADLVELQKREVELYREIVKKRELLLNTRIMKFFREVERE